MPYSLNRNHLLLTLPAALAVWLSPSTSQAGVPECNGIRLETAGSCEIRGDLECTGSCDDVGIYKKACATKLHTTCRDVCTLDPEPSCQDECTVACDQDCQNGINVICIHNCFGECVGSCDASCEGAADGATCRASCEATCDGECDIQCEGVVDGSCYQHCVECCGGSCGAQANMTCQTSCQEEEFETCEYEFRGDCMASCSGDGALFCDGEFVMAGPQMTTCLNALIELGIDAVEDAVDFGNGGGGFLCSVTDGGGAGGPLALALGLLGLAGWRRRKA